MEKHVKLQCCMQTSLSIFWSLGVNFPAMSMILGVIFFLNKCTYQVRNVPYIPSLLRIFIRNGYWIMLNAFYLLRCWLYWFWLANIITSNWFLKYWTNLILQRQLPLCGMLSLYIIWFAKIVLNVEIWSYKFPCDYWFHGIP